MLEDRSDADSTKEPDCVDDDEAEIESPASSKPWHIETKRRCCVITDSMCRLFMKGHRHRLDRLSTTGLSNSHLEQVLGAAACNAGHPSDGQSGRAFQVSGSVEAKCLNMINDISDAGSTKEPDHVDDDEAQFVQGFFLSQISCT